MFCNKYDKGERSKKLCPVSFGLAVGVVLFFAVLFESLWTMHYGMSPWAAAMHFPAPTLRSTFVHASEVLLKGFVFGFFVALLYDLISCCMPCKKSDEKSERGNSSPGKNNISNNDQN